MKRALFFLLLPAFFLTNICRAENLTAGSSIPSVFTEFIETPQASCPYLPLASLPENAATFPEFITSEQAKTDTAMIKYLFETAYSGTHYWKTKKVDFEGMYSALEALSANAQPIPVKRIEDTLVRFLSPIQDGHLSLEGRSRYRFFRHEDPFFADILVEETSQGFQVIDSKDSKIAVGEILHLSRQQRFPTLSPEGKRQYLIGCLSSKPRSWLFVKRASGQATRVALHPCRLQNADFGDEEVFRLDAIERIPHIRVCSFGSNYHNQLVQFEKTGQTLKSEKNIILNLYDNSGGSSDYGTRWVRNLNGFVRELTACGILFSPSIVEGWAMENLEEASPYLKKFLQEYRKLLPDFQKNPRWYWEWFVPKGSRGTGGFAGRLLVLVNRHVASSGELTTSQAKSVPNHLIVGENTAGIGTFGEVRTYVLPHSKIILNLPSKLFLEPGIREGRGYLPDFWLDTSEPVKELAKWIRYPQEYQFSFDIPAETSAIDFETWENSVPKGLRRSTGVSYGFGKKYGSLIPDGTHAVQGKWCGLLSGDKDAKNWYFFSQRIPSLGKEKTVSYSVKGENLHLEPGQIKNSYVGFIARKKNGESDWFVNSYAGTFDWKRETILLPNPETYESISFGFMLSIAGKLWLDDIRFSSDPGNE
jgi:hypothetical protein